MKLPARPLGAYLALAFILISILLTGGLVLIIENKGIGQFKNEIGTDLAGLALQTSDKLDRNMFERYREVSIISSQIAYSGVAAGNDAHRKLLARVQKSYRFYDWIGLTDVSGKVLVSGSGLLEGADVSSRPWFRHGLRGGYVGDVHEALLLAKLLPGQPGDLRRFVDGAFPYANAGAFHGDCVARVEPFGDAFGRFDHQAAAGAAFQVGAGAPSRHLAARCGCRTRSRATSRRGRCRRATRTNGGRRR